MLVIQKGKEVVFAVSEAEKFPASSHSSSSALAERGPAQTKELLGGKGLHVALAPESTALPLPTLQSHSFTDLASMADLHCMAGMSAWHLRSRALRSLVASPLRHQGQAKVSDLPRPML